MCDRRGGNAWKDTTCFQQRIEGMMPGPTCSSSAPVIRNLKLKANTGTCVRTETQFQTAMRGVLVSLSAPLGLRHGRHHGAPADLPTQRAMLETASPVSQFLGYEAVCKDSTNS